MKKIILPIILGIGMIAGTHAVQGVFFRDIGESHPLYQIGDRFATEWVLIDTENLSPDSPVTRDFYASMVMASSCTPCLVPSAGDISTYTDDAGMSDVSNTNSYKYCIAYTLRNRAIPSCTDDTYCPTDTISREDAIAWLLRHNRRYNSNITESSFVPTTLWSTFTRWELISMTNSLRNINQCWYIQPLLVPSSSTGTTLSSTGTTLTEVMTLTGTTWQRYRWAFGDGIVVEWTTSTISHTYARPGTYIVTVYAADDSREFSTSTSVTVEWIVDSDGDRVMDDRDLCPLVSASTENGCPQIGTRTYGTHILDILQGNTANSPYSLISWLRTNACLARYQRERWLIIGEPVCDTCPCQNRLSILEELRSCDIVFPSILSPDKSLIYSRGSFYQIQ